MEAVKWLKASIEKYGLRRILNAVTAICWFFFPFLLWWNVYRLMGSHFFVGIIAIPGQIALVFIIIFVTAWFINIMKYDSNLMKKIEYVKEVFENPADPSSEEKFRLESSRFVIPYLYFKKMSFLGMPSTFGSRLKLLVFGMLTGLYFSYSASAFIVTNQSYFTQVFEWFVSVFPILQDFAEFLSHNLDLLGILTFILSIPYDPAIDMAMNPHLKIKKSVVLLIFAGNIYQTHARIALAIGLAVISPLYLLKREKRLVYEPFIFPTNLHLVMQKAVHNVGRKQCQVSWFSYLVEDEEDIKTLQNAIWQEKDISILFRWSAISADPQQAVYSIKSSEPELHLGIVGHECAILGNISFDLNKKVRRAKFLFDSTLLKKEFKLIADKEISRQREIKPPLPNTLKEIMNKLEKKKERLN